jgi:MFS family permease
MTRSPKTDVRLLAIGRLVSITGGAAAYTALAFTVWHRTHSAVWQSAALFLTFGVVGIFSPLTGHFGDRFDRRRVLIISEGIAAAFSLAMAFAHLPMLLIALAFGSALAEAPFLAASTAAIPNLVQREDDVSWANSLLALGRNGGVMLGPVIGGVLLGAIGSSWVFALNAISFGASMVLTFLVRGAMQEERSAGQLEGGILEGVRVLGRDPVLRRLSIAWFVFLLGLGMSMVADAPLSEHFGVGASGFGLLIMCWGGGGAIGSFLGRELTERSERRWLVFGTLGVAVTGICIAAAPWFQLVLLSALVMGTADGLTTVAEIGVLQRRSPDSVRSRVMAAFDGVLSIGLAISFILAGPVLSVLGPRLVYAVGGVSAAAAALMIWPVVRPFARTLDLAPAPAAEMGARAEESAPQSL